MGKTKIEWTEASWNPVRGCSLVSEGCRNCYAMRLARRSDRPGGAYEGLTRAGSHGPTWSGNVRFVPEMLDYPLRLRKPHRIFVNSMSDLFHKRVTDAQIDEIFAVMMMAPQHTFQILTKRPERMLQWFNSSDVVWESTGKAKHEERGERKDDVMQAALRLFGPSKIDSPIKRVFSECEMLDRQDDWPLPNVWLGVSAEDQKSAGERIPYLLETPAAVRWVSLEPLLGPIDLTRIDMSAWETTSIENVLRGEIVIDSDCQMVGEQGLSHLDWVVAGGESGFGSRPSHPDWFRSLRDQCAAAGVPFFFKQWGSWDGGGVFGGECDDPCGRCVIALPNGSLTGTDWEAGPHLEGAQQIHRVSKKAAGRVLDGREHREYPDVKNSLASIPESGA